MNLHCVGYEQTSLINITQKIMAMTDCNVVIFGDEATFNKIGILPNTKKMFGFPIIFSKNTNGCLYVVPLNESCINFTPTEFVGKIIV